MTWARMLAYTGTVTRSLLRNEYLATENRILRAQIKGRLLLSTPKKLPCLRSPSGSATPLEELAAVAKPIRCWPGTDSSGWLRSLTKRGSQSWSEVRPDLRCRAWLAFS
jgi:hypothetical protein